MEESALDVMFKVGSGTYYLALPRDAMALTFTQQCLATSNTENSASSWMVPCLAAIVLLRKKEKDLVGQLLALFAINDFFSRKSPKSLMA